MNNCPSCGAAFSFHTPGAYAAVCGTCYSLVARQDARLLGQVADISVSRSPLRLQLEGVWRGEPFTLVGHTQLRNEHGGQWDEWYAHFTHTNRWGWLSEAQGHYYLLFETAAQSDLPAAQSLQAGNNVAYGGYQFAVQERGVAYYTAAAGELPFAFDTQSPHPFADLVGPRGTFASINLDRSPRLYMGHEVSLKDLGLAAAPAAEREAATVGVRTLACPQCGGTLELHSGQAEHVGCTFCGSLLDVRSEAARIITLSQELTVKSELPLGAEADLFGERWRLLGYMARSTHAEGVDYTWDEYLLYNPAAGFRWLVNSDTHWSFVRGITHSGVTNEMSVLYTDGRQYQRFQTCEAKVLCVVGEFYWRVRVGDSVEIVDYVAPPYIRSRESSEGEVLWSEGVYVPAAVIGRAFGVPLYESMSVGPNQPWPHRGILQLACMMMAVAAVLFVLAQLTGRQVATQTFDDVAAKAPMVLEDLHLSSWRNVSVTTASPGNELAIDAALVNDATGYRREFGVDLACCSDTSVFMSGPPSGTYTLRLDSRDVLVNGGGSQAVRVTVHQGRPDTSFLYWFGGYNLIIVALFMMDAARYETRRWSDS